MKKTPVVPGMILLSKFHSFSFILLALYDHDAQHKCVIWMNVATLELTKTFIAKKTKLYVEDYDLEYCGFI
jgi:hypothetical protein